MNIEKQDLRETLHEVIFEAETPSGRLFDILLLWSIVLSVGAVVLESVAAVRISYGEILKWIEWGFTILFTVEYALRIVSVKKPMGYMFSFYGLIDLLAILPTYLGLYFLGFQSLLVFRSIRMLRVFRVFKLGRYLGEADVLWKALKASRPKITVFLLAVVSAVLITGTIMYLVEGEVNGFTSIPKSVYWAIVTMTTVGYGDIAPQTVLGQTLASIIMIMGYAIIAVPTGIVTAELANVAQAKVNTITCKGCHAEGHDVDAVYCRFCSLKL